MKSITIKYGKTLRLSAFVALLSLVSCGTPQQTRPVADAEANFGSRQNFALTGGVTEEAGLTGFQRDSFEAFFTEAAREILIKRGLTEVGETQTDSADYIIRFILRDNLIVTALDPSSRRLIWRGQSDKGLSGETLSQSVVTKLVEQALNGFPPRR
jgi:membrane-bound lytic murein transglycosylase B